MLPLACTSSTTIASDALGRLYNKDAVVSHLLSRHQAQTLKSEAVADPIPHIRGLRDVVDLNLTPNTAYRAASPTTSAGSSEPSSSTSSSVYPFMCPLSSKQMDGKQRFVYISTCGCTMSYTGLRTTLSTSTNATSAEKAVAPCPVCNIPFNAASIATKGKKEPEAGGDVVTINPSESEQAGMREAMELKRAAEKAEKSGGKKNKKKEKSRSAEDDGEEASRKRRKADKKAMERSQRIAELSAELAS